MYLHVVVGTTTTLLGLMQKIQRINGREALELEAEFRKALAEYDEDRYLELERYVKQRLQHEIETLFESWSMARSWDD